MIRVSPDISASFLFPGKGLSEVEIGNRDVRDFCRSIRLECSYLGSHGEMYRILRNAIVQRLWRGSDVDTNKFPLARFVSAATYW